MWYTYCMSTSIKYTKELLQEAVDNSYSISGVLRYLGLKQAGGTQSHVKSRLIKYEIDFSHFTGQSWQKDKPSRNKLNAEDILVFLPEGSRRIQAFRLRRALIESDREYKCERCGLGSEWNGKEITLEVDHIDGEWLNNLIDNLRFMCPNCHSQEPTNRSWKNKLP